MVRSFLRSRVIIAAAVCFFSNFALAESSSKFPTGPNLEVTPGEVCNKADEYRYPERISYCKRDVESKLKNDIINQYDNNLGYSIHTMARAKFKIDHFIPLCMGGSNDRGNLWPQHESVYQVTDPLEPALCNKMAEGKILQAEAIDLIKRAKLHLDEVSAILAKVQAL